MTKTQGVQNSNQGKGCFAIFLLFSKHSLCEEEGASIHAYRSLWIKSPGSPGWMQATNYGIFFSPLKYVPLYFLMHFHRPWDLYKCHFASVTVKWLLCHFTSIFNNTTLGEGLPFLISSVIYGWWVRRSCSTVQVYQCKQIWNVFLRSKICVCRSRDPRAGVFRVWCTTCLLSGNN